MTDNTPTGDTLATMAAHLRDCGIPAEAANTGGNCHAIIVYLTDGDEALLGDEDGPMPDADEAPTGWALTFYPLDRDPMEIGGVTPAESPDRDRDHVRDEVRARITDSFDGCYDLVMLATLTR